MKFLTLILTPYILIYSATRNRRPYTVIGFVALFMVQFISLLPIGAVLYASYAEARQETAVIADVGNWTEHQPQMADYPLRVSWYDPALGGTNCDHDCTTMASGDKVASWLGGRDGVYAAACPRSDGWHHGKRFELNGVVYECRDTGGWINCYQPGDYDPATRRTADQSYCWVDLLNGSHYTYGSLAYEWRFTN